MSDKTLVVRKYVRFNYKGDMVTGGSFAQDVLYTFSCPSTKKTKTLLIRQNGLLKAEKRPWDFVSMVRKNNSTASAKDFYIGWAASASTSEAESHEAGIKQIEDGGLYFKEGEAFRGGGSYRTELEVSDDAFLQSSLVEVLEAESALKSIIGSSCANRHPHVITTLKSTIAEVMNMGKREVVESTGRAEFGTWGSGGSKAVALSEPYIPPVPVTKKTTAEISDAWGAW